MKNGFALPTVLIASTVMIFVLFTALAAAASMGGALSEQHYTKLAREAAESGAMRALQCYEDNQYVPSFTSNDLHPNNSCSGGASCDNSPSCFMYSNDDYRVTFRVEALDDSLAPQYTNSTGIVEVLRSSGNSVRDTFSYRQRVTIGRADTFSQVSFGYNREPGVFFGAIDALGVPQMLGHNSYGQLGNGLTNSSLKPRPFQLPDGKKAKSIHTNFTSVGHNVFVVTTDGELYAAGQNDKGQLGLGYASARVTVPKKVDLPAGEKAQKVYNLIKTTFVTTESHKLYSFGECHYGSLGTGMIDGYTIASNGDCMKGSTVFDYRPNPVQLNQGSAVNGMYKSTIPYGQPVEMAVDYYSAFARTNEGRVWGWGYNGLGEMGDNQGKTHFPTPQILWQFGIPNDSSDPGRAVSIAYDGGTSYVVTEEGKLYGSGFNAYRQLNRNESTRYITQYDQIYTDSSSFCKESDGSRRYIKVVADQSFVVAMTEAGKVCTAGLDGAGALGQADNSSGAVVDGHPVGWLREAARYGTSTHPPRAADITACSMGVSNSYRYNNTFIVTRSGEVWGAGSNYDGQLGIGTVGGSRDGFVKMIGFGSGPNEQKATQVECGRGTVVIVTQSGRVMTVGDNQWGQLGDGTTSDSSIARATKYLNLVPPLYF